MCLVEILVKIVLYTVQKLSHQWDVHDLVSFGRTDVDDGHHGSVGACQMGLQAWSPTETTLCVIVTLTEVLDATPLDI